MAKPIRHNPAGVMAAIARGTSSFPQLRVGQLIAGAVYMKRKTFDPFNVEDNDLIAMLDEFVKTNDTTPFREQGQ